jgi:hypothetical protein
MRDASTTDNTPIQVHNDSAGRPYVDIAPVQVPQVRVLFDSVGLKYTVEEPSVSTSHPLASIVFESETSGDEVQGLLDEVD